MCHSSHARWHSTRAGGTPAVPAKHLTGCNVDSSPLPGLGQSSPQKLFHIRTKFRDGRIRDNAKDSHVAYGWEFTSSQRIGDHERGGTHSLLPASLPGVAKNNQVRMQASYVQDPSHL